MDGLVCDACGATLLLELDVRYVVRIEAFAAYDPLEITREDLRKDLDAEMRRTLDELAQMSADEAQDQVHRAFTFDLCPGCHRAYLKDPLAGLRKGAT